MFIRKKCKHEYELVGDYYKESFTGYTNSFDEVNTWRKFRCKKCGEFRNQLLTIEKFNPQLDRGREPRREEYISKLIGLGFKLEVELLKECDEK